MHRKRRLRRCCCLLRRCPRHALGDARRCQRSRGQRTGTTAARCWRHGGLSEGGDAHCLCGTPSMIPSWWWGKVTPYSLSILRASWSAPTMYFSPPLRPSSIFSNLLVRAAAGAEPSVSAAYPYHRIVAAAVQSPCMLCNATILKQTNSTQPSTGGEWSGEIPGPLTENTISCLCAACQAAAERRETESGEGRESVAEGWSGKRKRKKREHGNIPDNILQSIQALLHCQPLGSLCATCASETPPGNTLF